MAFEGVLGKIIMGAILMIFGAVMIGVIADQSATVTTVDYTASEVHNVLPTLDTGRNNTVINGTKVYTLTNRPTGWKTNDCPITNFVLKNSTGSAFTDTTDYVLTASAGTYTLVNSATALATLPVANNNTYATYNYCPNDYVNSTFGRSVLNMIGGFIAIMMLIAAAGIFYSVYQETR